MRPTIKFGQESVEEKMKAIKAEEKYEITPEKEVEVITNVDTTSLQVDKVMKQFRLQKVKKGLRVEIDEDLHSDLKILCIKLGKTQEEYLVDLICDSIRKEKKKFEK